MLVLAKARQGAEFFYIPWSAHHVSKASAEKICAALNTIRYKLESDQVWHIYDVDRYDVAHDVAQEQSFYYYGGTLKEKRRAY